MPVTNSDAPEQRRNIRDLLLDEDDDRERYSCPDCGDTGVNGGGEDCRYCTTTGKPRGWPE